MDILIVEDEPTSLKLAHVILTTEGHTVTKADAAEEAIAMIKRKKPDIILLDLALPGMDGLTLARRLKNDPETEQIRIIAVTAYPDLYTKLETLNAGCDAYITKPIDTRDLPERVNDVGRAEQS